MNKLLVLLVSIINISAIFAEPENFLQKILAIDKEYSLLVKHLDALAQEVVIEHNLEAIKNTIYAIQDLLGKCSMHEQEVVEKIDSFLNLKKKTESDPITLMGNFFVDQKHQFLNPVKEAIKQLITSYKMTHVLGFAQRSCSSSKQNL